ncbi:Fe transport (CirA) (PDB:1BY3) [Commensalibacter communis]|uniref:Fe transport (CirA) n=1 Tax=Commensalibacter communis TaxID=2972786 RepID=A0A9W4TSI8_9PROT|nr:TonB-dependent receptor [Commensalibacter communis]CAI3948905.1 Fe transport (CirA) (PDB:1BY3) [Commensalibacter communis]CAI3950955.1 Fe transport (CirA) (PDB:1BY3) [Commensalibacter communis]CAI3952053.1 Fe transport (CirA) (PDB:1BY3) [Commensalibacter communis]CAI3953200.1 Fe transport (CirA) (PDB:1BY3) [Commensalibacter communis]
MTLKVSLLVRVSFVITFLLPCIEEKSWAQDSDVSTSSSEPQVKDQTDGEHITVTGKTPRYKTAYGYTGDQAGGGLIKPETADKSVSNISQNYIQMQAPTSNAFNLLSMLPGANVSTSDPYGISPQNDITIRGMTGDSIGYVMEGMPLNDVSDGLGYLSQFIDSENIENISLAQGAPDLDSPVYNAAGGVVNLKLRDPADKFGGMMDLSYGSHHTGRAFMRIDTGEIGKTGIKGFISYSYTGGNNWRGPGYDHRNHVDFKFTKEWGNDNHVTFFGDWNRTLTSSYYTPTKSEWISEGAGNGNNYSGTWYKDRLENTNYWKLFQQTFQQVYVAAPGQFTLNDKLQFKVTPYFQYGYGNSPYGTVLNENSLWQGNQPVDGKVTIPGAVDGSGLVMGGWYQRTYRSGFTPTLTYNLKHHQLLLGYWYDYSDDVITQPFTAVLSNGKPWDLWGGSKNNIHLSNGQQLAAENDHTITQVNAIFLGDHMNFMDNKLFIDAGFKQVFFNRSGWNQIPGPQYRTGNNVSKPLPRIGMRYQFTKEHQIFASVNTNFAVPHRSALFDTYDPNSGEIVNSGAKNLKTEYSIEEELGYRYNGPRFLGSITFFNYNYTNRMISTILHQNGAWVGSSINAGGQTSRGVDAEIGLKPWHHFSPYVSGEYLYTRMDNDLRTYGDLLPTKGKQAVRSPPWQFAVGLTYDNGHFFANGNVKMVGKQYATFMNDESIGSFATGNVAIGYRFDSYGFMQHPQIRMNFINITDQKYLSGVSSPTGNARTTTGKYGTSIPGSSPNYYIGGGFATMLTMTTAF